MKIKIIRSELAGEILIPASKSHTIRALTIAGMAKGESVLRNPLMSSDTLSCVEGIKELGATVNFENDFVVTGVNGKPIARARKIDVGNSGTTLRILSAMAALAHHPITFDGDKSIRKRLMVHLLNALENLGVKVNSTEGKCPFTVKGPMKGGKTIVNGISSQFLTALLLACPIADGDTEIIVENLHEKPYVEITLDWLRKQSITFENDGLDWFRISGRQSYKAFDRIIPADFSSATFALCAAAITGSKVLIKGLDFADHQGDKEVFTFLQNMGVKLTHTEKGVIVKGTDLQGIDIDMNNTPDALPALAVVGCFAKGQTRLLNVAQARLKECDRISAIATELKKMGGKVREMEDGLVIQQSELKGCNVHGYDDHRMVMALAIAGMAAKGETIVDTAESMKITYPTFADDMAMLGAQIEITD